ncbi:MAG: hypothetical protein HFF06_01280 [Oscillospiraceae bacterium]|jgi:hypothetical protein|nr:hypothetical protein [Oscillospiraceae bacterium]
MAKMVKKSPAPLYFAAAVWLVWGLCLPLYRLSDYLLAAGASLLAGVVGKAIFPDKTYETPEAPKTAEPQKPETTGNPELDALISERDKAVSEMRRLNDSIPGEKISAQIDHLEEMTQKIISHVVSHPEKLPQIRKFMNYYLPTTLKLLNAYDRMGEAGVEGENIAGTKGRIDAMMDTIVSAFDKQMDALFADEALDIATDITVMENLLKQEGLSGSGFAAGTGG